MRVFLILILLGAFGLQGASQTFYISLYDNIEHTYDIFKISLSDSTFNLECDNSGYNRHFAIRPVTGEFIKLHTVLGLYNIEMNYCNAIKWGNLINPVMMFFHHGYDSDKDGVIWGIGQDGIFKVNPPTTYFEFKGNLDPLVRSKLSNHNSYPGFGNYYTIFENDKTSIPDQLIAIDTADPLIWKIIYEFPIHLRIKDIIELHRSCGDQSLICFTTNNEFYELNLKNKFLKYLCKINFKDPRYTHPTTQRSEIYGSSPWLFDPAECDVFIDLDINNSSGNFQNGFDSPPLCSKSSSFISDNDPDVFSDYGTMDSVSIALLNPIDGNSEQISLIESFGVLSRSSPFALTLLPSSLTTNDSFALAIRSVLYENLMCQPSPASRFFRVVVYKNGLSDTAYSTIHLNGPFYNAGSDATINLCNNDSSVYLKDFLGACSSPSGIWLGPSNINGYFNPSSDLSGFYTYVVGDTLCGFDSATLEINVLNSPNFNFPNDTSICKNHTLTLNFKLPNVHLLWFDGDTSNSKTFVKPGSYWLTAFNDLGCSHTDTFSLSLLPTPVARKDTFICLNNSLLFKGKSYKPGEMIRDTVPSISSCDSLVVWSVYGIPLPSPQIHGDTLICQNDSSLLFVNSTFSTYSWSNSSQLPQTSVRSGTYSLTVTDLNGCSGETSITIRNVQPLVYTIQVQDPRCSGDYGSIQILPLSGGAPSFFFDLNGLQNSNGTFNQLLPGKYFFQITDSEGCSVLDSVMIHNGQELLVEMNQSIELLLNQTGSIPFNAIKGKVRDIWSNPPTNIILKSGNTFDIQSSIDQILTVIFSDENGCTYSLPLHLKIIRNQNIFFPNAFSPNGDQVNDLWAPFLGSDFHVISFSVFDRWGNLVFHSSNLASWDGKTNQGQLLPPGVYPFQLILDSPDNRISTHSGSITLFR